MIKYAFSGEKTVTERELIEDHLFGYVRSGILEVQSGLKRMVYCPGELFFFRRNQRVRAVRYPEPDGCFMSIAVAPDSLLLKQIEQQLRQHGTTRQTDGSFVANQDTGDPRMLSIITCNALTTFFDSLFFYQQMGMDQNRFLCRLKEQEGLFLLLEREPGLRDILFNFKDGVGKIDLEGYMNDHYLADISISDHAFQSGRSLATFKRDFAAIFHTSPGQWLQEKRLAEAYWLLREDGLKPVDVYKKVGFRNLSHFTQCFRKRFECSPARVRRIFGFSKS